MSIDFFGRKLNTYRANLHTHSTLSDGEFTPDQVTDLYSKAGYDVMCFTDHRKNSRISEIDPRGMLLLPGAELHPTGGRITISHLLCVNLPEDFDVSIAEQGKPGENHMQPTIDAVNAAGGLCFCAHPYWCGFRAEEIAALHGLAGIEVYNTSTRYIGKAYNMNIWDDLCDMYCPLPALAVDDVHHAHDLFGGWTEICCEERTAECITAALRNGNYYATQGPRFKRLSYHDGIFEAEFTPVTTAIGMSNRCRGFCAEIPNFTGDGKTREITSCRFDVSGFFAPGKTSIKSTYLRLQIIDAQGRYAWSNPVAIP